ncbi:MAG: molybdenum ABC transporter ATP-binding protein [Rhodospirillaceae bacterium]|nr:molybdenum ABC transporter ATP-binding protein [Rhodospirillaceae bacterium]
MSLSFFARHRLGAFTLDAAFESAGGLTALFGRSGSGKTTIVNIIGGLLRPERGRVVVDGRVLFDSEAGIHLPAHRRRLGYVFQEDRLFPHLTVRQNLLYGRWFTPRRERYGRLDQVVSLLGLEGLLHRQPGALSGGEKQRVAIGRALLAGPRLLLMDEPLASLDAARKAEILPFIERLRDELKIPIIYVSHSIDEIARLATTVVVVSDGRVAATGAIGNILSRLDLRPLTGRFEAGALLEGRLVRHDERFDLSILEHPAGELRVPRLAAAPGALVRMRVRARDVALALERPSGLSIRNVLRGRVAEIAPAGGPQTEVRLDLAGTPLLSRVTREAIAELGLEPGREVYALIKSIAFDRRSLLGHGGELSADEQEPPRAPAPSPPR